MKEKLLDKYLGDYFCLNPGKSANKTVQHRYWKIVSAIMEIRSIIEDCRANYVGGVQAGIDLWEVGVVPIALHNADTWVNIKADTMKKLE